MKRISYIFCSVVVSALAAACGSDDTSAQNGTGGASGTSATTGNTTSTAAGPAGPSTSAGSGGSSTTDTTGGATTATTGAGGDGTGTTATTGGAGGALPDGGFGTGTGGGGSGTGGGSGNPDGGFPGMVSIFDGTMNGWLPSKGTALNNAPGSWDIQDMALHSLGTTRGSLATAKDYEDFRLIFSVRHLPPTGNDHQPCVLLWGYRTMIPNDALGAIQLQPPNGSTWDYRPGKNDSGAKYVTKLPHPAFDNKQWSKCEILGHKATGQLRMACCQPIPCKGVEVVRFTDPTAPRSGPIGLQTHNAGLHDEYKDIFIEENPAVNDLITTK